MELKKLPDAEFDVMKVVWANEPLLPQISLWSNWENRENGKHKQ